MWLLILEYVVLFIQIGMFIYSRILTKRGDMTSELREKFSYFSWSCTLIICACAICYIFIYII